jgi:putative SOS response-associated peptidase YedK
MCARYTLTAPPSLVAELFGVDVELGLKPRYNIAPTQEVLALRTDPDGDRQAVNLRWGLIPSWAQDAKIGQKLINARAETVFEKPSFRSAAKRRRCLIAADGFFEWKAEVGKKQKQPYFIHRLGREPFAFAGLWENWHGEDDAAVETCTIITTDANETMKPLHNRMPVILTNEDFDRWLDPKATDAKTFMPLLRPAPDDWLTYYPVTTKMGNPRFHEPACVEPIDRI